MGENKSKIAVLASGNGSTVESFIRISTENDLIDAEVALVVCDRPRGKAGVYDRINNLNDEYGMSIPVVNINRKTHPTGDKGKGQTDEESQAILDEINKYSCDLVVLMGYMKIVRGKLLAELGYKKQSKSIYDSRLINTHPGPLPETAKYYGVPASQHVLDLGLKYSKHSVHIVAKGIDEGPIIAEHGVPILANDTADTLFARVQAIEKAALPYAIDQFIKKRRELGLS